MNDRELYRKKRQAQLDEWRAEVDKLKAKASGTSADAQLGLNEKIKKLESKIEDGKKKLANLANAGDEAWESIKDGVDSAWDSMKDAVSDAASKFKD